MPLNPFKAFLLLNLIFVKQSQRQVAKCSKKKTTKQVCILERLYYRHYYHLLNTIQSKTPTQRLFLIQSLFTQIQRSHIIFINRYYPMARQVNRPTKTAKPTKKVAPVAKKVAPTKAVPKRSTRSVARPAPKTKKIAKRTVQAKPKSIRKSVPAKPPAKPSAKSTKVVAKPSKAIAKPIKVVKTGKVTRSIPGGKSTTVAKVTASVLGYTPLQYADYKQKVKELQDWSNQKLKDTLRSNLQSMTGNKDQLIAKVADGQILGSIPRCHACFGGRPAFDFKKGTYTCKGYRDDTDFINCHKTFTLGEIKRIPWV